MQGGVEVEGKYVLRKGVTWGGGAPTCLKLRCTWGEGGERR